MFFRFARRIKGLCYKRDFYIGIRVLRYAYQFSHGDICDAFINLFGLKNVHLSNPTFIAQAIEWQKLGLDFSDALHLTQCQQYEKLYTFDKKFTSKAKNLTDCLVALP